MDQEARNAEEILAKGLLKQFDCLKEMELAMSHVLQKQNLIIDKVLDLRNSLSDQEVLEVSLMV